MKPRVIPKKPIATDQQLFVDSAIKLVSLHNMSLLKERNVVYSRADKGNAIVIMDKNDYDSRVLNMINEGPYEECKFKNGKPKDPLNTMIDEANVVRQKVARLMGDEKLERRLYVPNPKVASLYCLPKIHKNPLSMRPISSNICTPTEKMAAWLVDEIKRYPVTHGKSVKNSIELVDQIKDLEIRRSEIMVSFDVASLFPSVPVEDALKSLRAHLERKQVPSNHIAAYLSVAQLCMKQNLFMFRGKFYKQNFGLSMGSKLSPLLAEVFMSDFETEVQKDKMFPRVWKRYVDDVFALVKERYLPQTLNLLNSKHDSIRFTVEKEQDGTLPFLDLRISIKEDKTLKFGIYRKPTSTDRFITSDSNHFGAQKQAAFHSMAHRLFNIPLEDEEFNAEREKIHKIAGQNGYDSNFVNKILRKHERKRHRQNATTLQPDSDEKEREEVNHPRKGYIPKPDMCRDEKENLATNEREVIDMWKQFFEQHLNGDTTEGSETEVNLGVATNDSSVAATDLEEIR
ncbi:uncharacterized protein LOC128739838 [Sabethes cyaneus]|uniref:uncharacterized protein LOC128739838 n=1 Tax=Sabethes cyaneus TaxID=53552 RepID=UPI00237E1D46|nr:uncharacterized protein LOC128739838 [Sabethes cyaneus]